MFPKKPFSKISTEHLECSYDYHEGKIRQKVKKTSLRVQKRRKNFSAENLTMDTSNEVLSALSKTLYRKAECFAQDSKLLEKMVFFVEKSF